MQCASLQFYDDETHKIFKWYDNSKYLPYLLTTATPQQAEDVLSHDAEYIRADEITKYDAIEDMDVTYTRVYAQTPYGIGGESRYGRESSFRQMLKRAGYDVWEDNIRFDNSFCYDNKYEIGMPYVVTRNQVTPLSDNETQEKIEKTLKEIIESGARPSKALDFWVRLFEHRIPELKILAVDIEVETIGNAMPNSQKAERQITAISLITNDSKLILMLRIPGKEMGVGKINGKFELFETEEDLLESAFEIIDQYPWVITFNGDDFDMRYMYNRAKRLRLSPVSNPIILAKRTAKLRNGIHIDLYPFMKNPSIKNYAFGGKYDSFTLEDISQGILGRGKVPYDGSINDLDYTTLANYCLEDSQLILDLMTNDNNLLTNLILILARISNISVYQITRNAISTWVVSTLNYISRCWNNVIPNQRQLMSKGVIQTEAKIEGKTYQGAIVQDPQPGIHFKVIVMDFASLYPTEVKERNIGFASINCSHPECQGKNIVPFTTHHICSKNRAIESDVIGALRDVRVFKYKALGKESPFYFTLQQSIKVFINASYGVFGSPNFALHCPPVAEAIASHSRQDMINIIDKATELGIPPMYGDTDSIFIKNPDWDVVKELQDWTKATLTLDLGVDHVYRYAIFSDRKKNYLGIGEDGKPDIKGLTGKKSQTPDVIKVPFYKVVDILCGVQNEDEYPAARKEVHETVRVAYDDIRNRKWKSIKELAFHMRLSRPLKNYETNPQHVKAGRMLVDAGFTVSGGEMINYIKTNTKAGVVPLQLAKDEDVNIHEYTSALQSVMEQILEPMDIDFISEIAGKTSLDMFFGNSDNLLSDFLKKSEDR